MTQRTTIYFGPPGTGKTARLLAHVRDAVAAGVPPERIAFLAFSRKAAREARERAREELGLGDDQLVHWRTLHSTAARQLNAGGHLVAREHWRALGDALGMELGDTDEAGRPNVHRRDVGGRVQSAYALRRARHEPLDLAALCRALGERTGRLADQFVRTLAVYKERHGLLDYADLLDEAPGALPVDVAFVDEAQDLTPAQWDYALRAVDGAADVYVAGDDDQAIYDWAGADVSRLLSLDGRREVLSVSHRLPRAVRARAVAVTDRIRTRQPKDWTHAGREGAVEQVAVPERVPVAGGGTWLLLARTRAMLDRWESVCRGAGVRYVRTGADSVRQDEARAVRAWETMRRGGAVPGPDARLVDRYAGAAWFADTRINDDGEYALAGPLPVWHVALAGIPPARRRYYEACVRRDPRSLSDPPRVTVSTVHGAKGGEADHVALLTDITPRVADGMRTASDAEHRVWYVAATRARETLWLVRPQTAMSYRL